MMSKLDLAKGVGLAIALWIVWNLVGWNRLASDFFALALVAYYVLLFLIKR